jgi:hypothetical protein
MGSISNPGIGNLALILSNSGASLASAAITSPTVQAALQNTSASDLVQLSEQAVQLQETEGLFAGALASPGAGLFSSFSTPGLAPVSTPSISSLITPGTSLDSLTPSLDTSLLSALDSSANSLSANANDSSVSGNSQQTGSNSSSSTSPADQLALYQADLLSQQTQLLFGGGSPAQSSANTLNLLA